MNLTLKTRVHDSIIGTLNLLFILGAYYLAMPQLLIGVGVISAFMIMSYFTKFCPLYFTLEKIKKDWDRWSFGAKLICQAGAATI